MGKREHPSLGWAMKMARVLALALPLGLGLGACTQPAAPSAAPAPPPPQAAARETAPAPATGTQPATAGETGASTSAAAKGTTNPFAFTVQIILSPAAAQRLATAKETIMVSAFYYGVPRLSAPAGAADEMGQVHLGNQDIELHGAGNAVFDGHVVDQKRLAFVDGDPQVNVNVYSGRRSSERNVLNCDFFEDAIQLAQAKPIAIHCGLLGE